MDTMKIGSGFMQNLISKIIKAILKKKFGVNIDIYFNDLISFEIIDDQVIVDLSITAKMPKEDLSKMLKDLV